MTREEVHKAWKDQTWLVDTITNRPVRVTGRVGTPPDDTRWYGHTSSCVSYWLHEVELRIATAKDLLELG